MRTRAVIGVLSLALSGSPACSVVGGLTSTVVQNFTAPRPAPAHTPEPVSAKPRFSALWIGHATVLLQMGDKVILTDPWFTNHIAQLKMRLVEPGLSPESIPSLDLIVVSHSHADHCNLGSLGMLAARFPGTPLAFPAGVEEFLPALDLTLVRMQRAPDTGGEITGGSEIINGIRVTAIRANHWGGRYGLDGTLWGEKGYAGFIIEYAGRTVYFSGDTGYDPRLFHAIGERFRIDLALLPIGPTAHPDSLGTPVHVYALGALRAFEDTGARMLIPVHYGTTHEPFDRLNPRTVLEDILAARPELTPAAEEAGAAAQRVIILQIGQQVILP